MVAEAAMMPNNPDEKEHVREVLEGDPALRKLVQRVSDHAGAMFPHASFKLSTKQYDEWDPPLTLNIVASFADREEFSRQHYQFVSWLAHDAANDPDRLLVMLLPDIVNRDAAS